MLICAGYMERFGIVVAIVLLLSVSDVDDCDDVDSAAAGIGNAVSVDDNNVADCQPFCFFFLYTPLQMYVGCSFIQNDFIDRSIAGVLSEPVRPLQQERRGRASG